ncbi:hypothetical protein BpHYR1_041967 [Brachionus plicatilis]|uniref:Uncharacterized protein n=1 Tax=Brachionus plicatilis TaxID=10195 RepID=A0A3M7QCH3_BRAPC|nr:hypothetical protein BpHYR1_041967 [Brachionus plicatilis]
MFQFPVSNKKTILILRIRHSIQYTFDIYNFDIKVLPLDFSRSFLTKKYPDQLKTLFKQICSIRLKSIYLNIIKKEIFKFNLVRVLILDKGILEGLSNFEYLVQLIRFAHQT